MSSTPDNSNGLQFSGGRGAVILAVAVMWIAVTGYFIGITSPSAPPLELIEDVAAEVDDEIDHNGELVVPATDYADLVSKKSGPNADHVTRINSLKQLAAVSGDVKVQTDQKLRSLESRSKLRAFNGAPPTTPHAIDQMNDQSCIACHGVGLRSASIRAAKMPHPVYANCTQCHVEQTASSFPVSTFVDNSFQGLPAPTGGPRAYPNAPPLTPHSTWLRQDCLSCHGRTAHPGLRTSHPQRRECLQCHPTSSVLNQNNFLMKPEFLAPLTVEEKNNE